MKSVLKQTIILGLFLISLTHEMKASFFGQRFTARIIPESAKVAMDAATARVKQAAQTSWSKINRVHMAVTNATTLTGLYALALKHEKERQTEWNLFLKQSEERKSTRDLEIKHEMETIRQMSSETMKQNTIYRHGLTACTDPKLLELFNTIKQDMGITQEIPLFIITMNKIPWFINTNEIGLGYTYRIINPNIYDDKQITMGISLNLKAIGNDRTMLIYIIAHELGHFLQFNGDPGSYQSKHRCNNFFTSASDEERKIDNIKSESGAEANAAGYVDCQYCLEHVKNLVGEVEDPRGYFSKIDYQPYIDRAVENNWSCPAHTHLRKQSFLAQAGHVIGIAPIPFKPSDFFPVRDRSNYPDGCIKTPPTF